MNRSRKLEILEGAKNLLNTEGCVQGRYYTSGVATGKQGYCLVGALGKVAGYDVVDWEDSNGDEILGFIRELSVANFAMVKFDDDREWATIYFNDSGTTTEEDVIDFIDEYIAEVEKEEE